MDQGQSTISKREITFPDGRQATLVKTPPTSPANEIITALGLEKPAAIILILGGADIADTQLQAHLLQLFSRGLARAIVENNALIIDGGTESEAIRTLGKALVYRANELSWLEVADDSVVTDDANDSSGRKMLESHHTHFVVVKSTSSDGKIDTAPKIDKMCEIARELSQDIPILTVLVNGDTCVKDEVLKSVQLGWPILVIKGSGGFADEIQGAWKARQDDIKRRSIWKPTSPNESEPTPLFINDLVLDEVVAEGNLHFFSITDTPENLVQSIDLQLKTHGVLDNSILNQAYTQQQIYSAAANRHQKTFRQQQNWILFLGVLITALAAFQAFDKQTQWISHWSVPLPFGSGNLEDILYFTLISLPVLLALLIARTSRLNADNKWIGMRVASQAFKREIFRYRTRTGIYSDRKIAQNNTTREATLATMLESITNQWVKGHLDHTTFPAPAQSSSTQQSKTRSTPKSQKEVKKNVGSVYLPPNGYITERLIDQLNYYQRAGLKLGRRLSQFQWIILIVGGVATLLAALHAELLITVTTALAAALTTYLEYNQVANTLKQYNHAILTLTNIQNWWAALGDAQADQDNIDRLVDFVETTLQTEQTGWVQQMQAALTELRTQQAKQGSDPSVTGPLHTDPHMQ